MTIIVCLYLNVNLLLPYQLYHSYQVLASFEEKDLSLGYDASFWPVFV